MDADGDVLAPLDWSEHNLSGVETKAAEARRFAEVKKRAATGDRTSQFTLLKSWLEELKAERLLIPDFCLHPARQFQVHELGGGVRV